MSSNQFYHVDLLKGFPTSIYSQILDTPNLFYGFSNFCAIFCKQKFAGNSWKNTRGPHAHGIRASHTGSWSMAAFHVAKMAGATPLGNYALLSKFSR